MTVLAPALCLAFQASCSGGGGSGSGSGGAGAPGASSKGTPQETVSEKKGPGPPPCGDERNELIAEYRKIGLELGCADFTKSRRSQFFDFSELVGKGEYEWALIRDPLITPTGQGYGLDLLRTSYGASRAVNSGFRDPVHNRKIGGAKRSRHMYGDAVDLRNVTRSRDEWDRMWMAAAEADADYIEPLAGPCKLNCLHADWRNHEGRYTGAN